MCVCVSKTVLPVMAPPFRFDLTRRRLLTSTKKPFAGKSVIYWMSRDQRADDNWALLYAHYLAAELGGLPVKVVFNLVPKFLEATLRQYGFMLKGLEETEKILRSRNIPFTLLSGWPTDTLPSYIETEQPAAVVCDMSPLRVPMAWVKDVAAKLDKVDSKIPLYQVDAHNIVPVWHASPKQETGARTLRPKINALLPKYLTEFPPTQSNSPATALPKPVNWKEVSDTLEIDRTVAEVTQLVPGSAAAMDVLDSFCTTRLKHFADKRNDPNETALSGTSPYTHFGQLSAQRAALYVKQHGKSYSSGVSSFIEESVVRRELSDNFCYYNENYDSISGAAMWAQDSLELHASDKREYVYSRDQLNQSKTHDPLWNAAQNQLVLEGKMHGFLRMYWAKKILEWTESPEEALATAIYLNDRYSIDGRDPNGYVGCMWSICGIHDMGWKERPVFGKIRFMNYNGCKRKFKVALYETKYARRSGKAPMDKFIASQPKKRKAEANESTATQAPRQPQAPIKKKVRSGPSAFAKLLKKR